MSGDAILFRSDAKCVRVNKLVNDLVVCLSLSVSLLIDLSPILSFLNIQHFFISFLPCLETPLPHFLYPLLFPFSLSLYTPLPQYFHPPIFFTSPLPSVQLRRNSVRSWVFAHSTRTAKLLVLFNATLFCPCVIHVMRHCQFNTEIMQCFTAAYILSLTCGLRQWYVLGPAQERTD